MQIRTLLILLLSAGFLSGCAGPISPLAISSTPSAASSSAPTENPSAELPLPPSDSASVDASEPPSDTPPKPAPAPTPPPQPLLSDFVRVRDYLPGVLQDLKYATTDNFTGQTIYSFSEAYVRYGTLLRLARAQAMLAEKNYSLLIWDAFRPVQAQFRLWEVCPNPTYVANPNKGFSSHSRGNTVDVTLVSANGEPVEMPTGFDDFSPLADRDYSDVSPTAAANARLLEDTMSACGFKPYSGEWWHFSDTNPYPVEEHFLPE